MEVSIRSENDTDREFSNDAKLPHTTKSDEFRHGYGLRSILLIVEKYGGDCKIYTESDTFVLDILFPGCAA